MPDRLHFTESDEANALIATDPMALLIGFALDQQVSGAEGVLGPAGAKERLGTLDAGDARRGRSRAGVPREARRSTASPARWPSACTTSPSTSATSTTATPPASGPTRPTPTQLRANLEALPGFGEMKVKALGAVLAKRFGVAAAQELVPWHPTLGDVDSAAGAGRLPGRQARPQEGVEQGPAGGRVGAPARRSWRADGVGRRQRDRTGGVSGRWSPASG